MSARTNGTQPPDLSEIRSSKQKLADAIRDQGISQSKLASILEENHSSFRTWMKNNRFPIQTAEKLADWMNLTGGIDELSSKYEFETIITSIVRENRSSNLFAAKSAEKDRLSTLLIKLDSSATNLLKPTNMGDFRSLIHDLFSVMEKYDSFIMTCFDTMPYEFSIEAWASVGTTLADRIRRGAYFVYLCPDLEYRKRIAQAGISIDQNGHFQNHFAGFRDLVVSELGDDRELVDKHLIALTYSTTVFAVPGFKFCCYRSAASGMTRLFVHLPSGDDGASRPSDWPLDPPTTSAYLTFIQKTFKEHEAREETAHLKPSFHSVLYATRSNRDD